LLPQSQFADDTSYAGMMIMGYTEINAKTIDQWVSNGWEWGQYVSHDEYSEAIHGRWSVKLTPVKTVPREWFGDLNKKKVLGLASGGGQQMPIFVYYSFLFILKTGLSKQEKRKAASHSLNAI